MFAPFEWMLAVRYLRARRKEGFISVIAWFSLLGIALGVATLIIVLSVMNGFREELLSRILGLNGHFTVQAAQGGLSDYNSLAARLQKLKGVIRATPIIQEQAMALAGGVAQGAIVRGIAPSRLRSHPTVSRSIVSGSLDAFGGTGIVVGSRLAQKLGIAVGGKLVLVSPRFRTTAFGTVPRMKTYTVVALFEVGMYEYDSSFIFMPLAAAQVYFGLKDRVSGVEIVVDDPDRIDEYRREIEQATRGIGRVIDWQRANAQFFNALQVERNVMFLILTLIILVAAFNIVSSLIMLVKDKGRDIAILRTMGASRGAIMRVFFISGASIGVMGTILGFLLGIGFADNIETVRRWIESLSGTDLFAAEIYFLSRLPAKVDSGEVTLVVLMGLGLSVLATIYPSWRAARIDPVEALRYE